MKVCVPVDQDNGMDSIPAMDLESAPLLVIHDTGSGATEAVENTGQAGTGGGAEPLRALKGMEIDVLITGRAEDASLKALWDMGVKVYKSMPGTISGNIEVLKMGDLEELEPAKEED
jgi:ArsR family transcriptional regulator